MQHIKDVPIKGAKWGIAPHNEYPEHFFTGYVNGRWGRDAAEMQLGRNVILEGGFVIERMSRGRSAANFHGHFLGHPEVSYEMGMKAVTDLLMQLQTGEMAVQDQAFYGLWTFAKQGCDIFLVPAKPE